MKTFEIFTTLTAIVLTGCVNGSHVVTGTVRPAITADGVKIYSAMPTNAETIGIVSGNQAFGVTSQGEEQGAVAQLKKQAAKIGANGVVIDEAKWKIWVGGTASGTAIYVPEK